MKFVLTLLMATALQVAARAQSPGITLSLRDASLSKVFNLIEQQTDYSFVYSNEAMALAKPVTVNVQHGSLDNVLKLCFDGQPLGYTVDGKMVIVKVEAKKKITPDTTLGIKGIVTNESGQPIAGATIIATSTGKITVANDDGSFSMDNIKPGDLLEINSIGYSKKTVQVKRQNPFVIRLKSSVSVLDETVVMAYGKTSRRFNTGNISKVSSKLLEKQPVENPLLALQGLVPGLSITQTSGLNGAAVKVQIRGQNSILQGSQPLYIVDGIPFAPGNDKLNQVSNATDAVGMSPFNLIDINSIESIEILKDADATAIYGSRGANGVIMITTKKGVAGKTKLTVNAYTGFSKVSRTMDMLNTQQYVDMSREAFVNDGMIPSADASDPGYAPDIMIWDTTRYTDIKKLLIGGTAQNTNVQIALSGGSANTQFLVSAGYTKNTTVFPTNLGDKKLSAYFNLNHQSNDKRLRFHFDASLLSDENKMNVTDLTSYINLPPNIKLYTENGGVNWEEKDVLFRRVLYRLNPLAALKTVYNGQFKNFISNTQVNYKLLDHLTAKVNLGYNILQSNETGSKPSTSIDPNSGNLPSANFSNNTQYSWIAEPQIEYVKDSKFGRITVLAGGTWQETQNEGIYVQAFNYANDALLGSVSGAGKSYTRNNLTKYRYNAMFGRITYEYKNRYIVNASGRRDGSTRFGPSNRFANFGAIGMAWVFSNEKFFNKGLPFISFGKVRGSYGVTGNDQIGDYRYLDTWQSSSDTYNGVAATSPSALYNPDFSWERNKKLELSLDIGFFKGRLLISGAFYRNVSSNQLIDYTLPIQTGFPSVLENLNATLVNKGLEIQLETINIKTNNFRWSSSINVTSNRNKLLSFPGLANSSYANTFFIGRPVTTRQLYAYTGVNPADGVYAFEDVNKDGILDKADRIKYVSVEPKFFGGFLNSFSLRNLSLSILFEFKKQPGYNFISNNNSLYTPGYGLVNQPVAVLDRWQKSGDVTGIQKFTANSSSEAFYNMNVYLPLSNANISDASFVRCKNVSLSYSLPTTISKRIHADNCIFYINAQNLFVITGYKGADPETQNLFVLPPMKTVTGGFKIIF